MTGAGKYSFISSSDIQRFENETLFLRKISSNFSSAGAVLRYSFAKNPSTDVPGIKSAVSSDADEGSITLSLSLIRYVMLAFSPVMLTFSFGRVREFSNSKRHFTAPYPLLRL